MVVLRCFDELFPACYLDLQMSNESIVHLKTVTDIDLSKLGSLKDMKIVAANCDMVHQLEEILMQWYKQIEQVCILCLFCLVIF